ncbi:MAG: lipocalin family protein [Cyclobacteriaceae bacterium]
MRLASLILFFAFGLFLGCTQSPEATLVGDWRAISQDYVKFDAKAALTDANPAISELPEADIWRFNPDKSIFFLKDGKIVDTAEWKLKGRGHMVGIIFPNHEPLRYQIKHLTDDDLVIYLNLNKEVRAVAKIEFERHN